MKLGRWIFGMLVLAGLVLPVAGWSAPVSPGSFRLAPTDSLPPGPPLPPPLPPPPPPPGDSSGVVPGENFYAGIHWGTVPALPCAERPTALEFDFCTCNVSALGLERDPSGQVRLRVRINDYVCIQCAPDTVFLPLGQLAAGFYTIDIEIDAEFLTGDSLSRTEVTHRAFSFSVFPTCPDPGPSPPPGPGSLPFVTAIRIGVPSPCMECPPTACPNDSIPVFITGEFPDNCIGLAGVELLPSPIVGPMPEPPVLRIVYATNSCLARPCVLTPYPWSAFVKLPPLPPRVYSLLAETAQVDVCTDSLPRVTGNAVLPFTVVDSCGAPPPGPDCFAVRFENATVGDGCDALVSPEQPAVVTLDIASGVALAGLQGKLALYPPGLAVARLEPVGVAAGMHLAWKPTEQGASFVLFADRGAPIPDTDLRRPVPILRVAVAAAPGVPIPERSELYSLGMLGSDSTGTAVPECPSLALTPGVLNGATICRGSPCDVNGDGVADVRDLVLMVHCVLGSGPCPGDSLDCNRDGSRSIDDVLCCAHGILRGDLPPDTTGGRVEPGVTVRLRDAVRTTSGVDLPLTLLGADRVGAARFELVYPSDRYEVAGVDVVGGGAEWLGLHETTADRLVIGLIGLSGAPTAGAAVDMVVHLTLKPGESVGGEVTLVGTQISGPDGVTLRVDAGVPSRPLGLPAGVALSASRPNPFSRETRFTVTVAAAGELDVSIFDLQGRRVANLYRGHADAGSVDLVWKRTRSDGTAVASGVYFYRATSGGATATSKVLVMSRE